MKRIIIFYFILLSSLLTYGQGIKFEESLNWQQILAKAEKENKYIFVDCFATWCGPCKIMDREIFSNDTVGSFFKQNYISVKIQFDSTANDNEYVKMWTKTAKLFGEKYYVDAFPTYLFFNPKGILVSKQTGAITPYEIFLSKSKSMLNPEEQYYTLLNKYNNGDNSQRLIKKIGSEAFRLQDWKTLKAIHEKFVSMLDTPYTKEDLIAVYAGISNSSSKGFDFLVKDIEKYNSILEDDGRVQSVLKSHLYTEVYEKFVKGHEADPKWKRIEKYIDNKAPIFTHQIVMLLQVNISHDKKEWEKFGKLRLNFFDAFARKFDHNDSFFMNNDLMEIFRRCSDITTLLRAAEWSKYTLDVVFGPNNVDAIDTYANLLYKAGNTKQAIEIQKKAVQLVSKSKRTDKVEFTKNLQKMELGIPTWINDQN